MINYGKMLLSEDVASLWLEHALAHWVEVLRYKPEGRGFDFRWCYWNFSFYIILPAGLWSWG